MPVVDGRDDAPDRLAVAESHERLDHVLPHERRPTGVEGHADLVPDGLDPARIDGFGAARGGDEGFNPATVGDGPDLDAAHFAPTVVGAGGAAFGSSSAVRRTASSICSSVCSELRKNLSRASRSGMAGWMIG